MEEQKPASQEGSAAIPTPAPEIPPTSSNVKKEKSKKVLWIAIGFFVLALVVAGAYFIGSKGLLVQEATPTPTAVSSPEPTPEATPDPTTDWQIYKNEQYGFQISYPSGYQVLTDAKNLYGWPDAVALLYKGGQSYDLVIEVWDKEADYLKKYQNNPVGQIAVKTSGGKFFTLLNQNNDSEVSKIIDTFKFTE